MRHHSPSTQWTGTGLTDRGLVRTQNQDAFTVDNDLNLWVLADGMGGHAGGEVASRIAVESIPRFVRPHLSSTSLHTISPDALASLLYDAVESANQAILEEATNKPELEGMGTTVVLVAITDTPEGQQAIVCHAGDSRAYLFREGALVLWTTDHSLIEERLASHLISQEEARVHPLRHVITKALGIRPVVHPSLQRYALSPGDCLLLCSDGLTKMLTDHGIQTVMRKNAPQAASTCQALVEAANQSGGEDNTTVVVIAQDSSRT